MPLYWFLLVISALGSDSLPPRDVAVERALLATFGALLGWGILAFLASRFAARQVNLGEVGYHPASAALNTQMDWLRWLGLALSTWTLTGFGLAGIVENIPWAGESIAIRSLLLILPAVLVTLWSWCCELRFDHQTHPDAGQRSGYVRYLGSMLRLQGAWLLVPVLVLLALMDLTQWVMQTSAASGAIVSGGIAILGIPFLLPKILGTIWHLTPITNPAKGAWCDQLIAATKIRGIRLFQWNTGGTLCTAMVAGFLPGFRRLLVSDALLWRLTPGETAMVLLHELAHIRRWHLPLRLISLVPIWGLATLISHLLAPFAYADLAGIAVGLVASLITLRVVAYQTEYDADLVAVNMASNVAETVPGVPPNRASAAAALASALEAVTSDNPSSRQATWLHPSVTNRCERLRAIAAQTIPSAEPTNLQLQSAEHSVSQPHYSVVFNATTNTMSEIQPPLDAGR